jgi:hypothetical protein
MMRRLSPGAGTLVAAALLAGCGPAPYAIGPDEPAATLTIPEARPTADDKWIPGVFPRPNPFVARRTWVGEYDCPQGRTRLTLRVVDARGTWVRAIFDFHHLPSNASGQYYVAGHFDETSGRVRLEPGPWIAQPPDYETVGMDGQIAVDGQRFTGKITNPGCGAFRLRPER